jgi:hypothetical protein
MRESLKQMLIAVLLLVGVGVAVVLYRTIQDTQKVLAPELEVGPQESELGGSTSGNLDENSLLADPDGQIVALVGTTTLKIDLARTEEERAQGLSGRESLAEDEAMLFIFPTLDIYGFWMKEMNFDLDIIWLDGAGVVADITPNVSRDSYPQVFYPRTKIKYGLEVPAGWAGRHNIALGDELSELN